MAYRSPRRHVTWKEPETRVPEQLPHPYMHSDPADLEAANRFLPGTLWRTTRPMTRVSRYDGRYRSHEAPYATTTWRPDRELPAGTVAVCLGTLRVTEARHDGSTVSVLRHSFLMGGCRYLVLELSTLESLNPTLIPE